MWAVVAMAGQTAAVVDVQAGLVAVIVQVRLCVGERTWAERDAVLRAKAVDVSTRDGWCGELSE